MKKMFVLIAAVILCAVGLFGLAGCKDDEEELPPGVKEFVFEAEYVDLDGKASITASGSIQDVMLVFGDGTQADKNRGWSNGYYIHSTSANNFRLDFVITSDAAAEATIILRLGSLFGTVAFNASNYSVRFNETAVNFGTISLAGSTEEAMQFTDYRIPVTVQLLEGENTISLITLNNTFQAVNVGGPSVDCIKVRTTAALTWDIIDNPSFR